MTQLIFKELSYAIVGAAMEVHSILGPGYLERVYQKALAQEFALRYIPFEEYKPLAVFYKDVNVGDFVADFVVDENIIVEIKARSVLEPIHVAQAHNYLASTGLKLAILLNFGAKSLERQRVVR